VRVHLIVHRFPPEGMGGTELYTLHLARGLIAGGHQVTVLTHAEGEGADLVIRQDVYDSIPVRRLAFTPDTAGDPVRDEYDNRRVAAAVRRLWEAERPDLVHVTHFGYLSTSVTEVADTMGIPWLATLTDFWAICPNGRLLRADGSLCHGPESLGECVRCVTAMGPRGAGYAAPVHALPIWSWALAARAASWPLLRATRWARWLAALDARGAVIRQRLLRARAIFCPGAHAREMLIVNGYPRDLIDHAPHGILDPQALRRHGPPADGPVLRLGYLGPLDHAKGAHLPIDALASLSPDVPVSLTYRGALPSEASPDTYAGTILDQFASSDRARHGGPYSQNELRKVLHSLDVLVVPSLWYENTPTVIYEAVAASVPVIATDLGGMRELVGALRGGWLFPRGDAGALASLIRELALDRGCVRRIAGDMAPVPAFAEHLTRVSATYARILGAQ
jgi:glycosyltransferase involved in cell wall biosynthesis